MDMLMFKFTGDCRRLLKQNFNFNGDLYNGILGYLWVLFPS